MDSADALTLKMHDPIWVDTTDGPRRPDHAMSFERYPDGRVMVETRLNGWKHTDQVHRVESGADPTPPPVIERIDTSTLRQP